MKNERTSRRTGIAFGLSAGLIGGTVAGLTFGIPGVTSAASDDVATPAAVVQVDTQDAAANRGDRLRGALDELVENGTISAEQADAVADHLVEQATERIGTRDRPGLDRRQDRRADRFAGLSELLGIDGETLRTELRSGSTLAEIAEANDVTTDELVDALVAEAMERIDAAVEDGRIEQDVADERAADLEAQITERVTTPRGER